LIGLDGAGKTSTFNILGGVMAATAGDAKILPSRTPPASQLTTAARPMPTGLIPIPVNEIARNPETLVLQGIQVFG